MIETYAFKERKKEGGERRPQLGGQWGSILFNGQWKVPCLVSFEGKGKTSFLPPSTFHPIRFYF